MITLVLNDLSSVFLGLTYIVGGKVFASFDKARDPIMNFTNSNVKDGSFTYTGSAKTSRFTTALVRYVDKYENFKPKVEYVEDSGGIIKYGLIEKAASVKSVSSLDYKTIVSYRTTYPFVNNISNIHSNIRCFMSN